MEWEIFIKNSKSLKASDEQIYNVIDFLESMNVCLSIRHFAVEIYYYFDYTSGIQIKPLSTTVECCNFDKWKERHTSDNLAFNLLNDQHLTIFPFAIEDNGMFRVYETNIEVLRSD